MRRILLLGLCVLALAVATAAPARARHLEMARMEVELRVDEDGILHVTERMDVRFSGSFNGIYRFIPYADLRTAGFRRSLALRLDAVEDGTGRELEHWTTRKNGNLRIKIRVPGARDATRRVVVRYRAMNVVLGYPAEASQFGGHDELFWNVVGTGWRFPIHELQVRVRLPASLDGASADRFSSRSWRGSYGEDREGQPDALTRDADGSFHLAASRFRPGEAFTLALAFPPGHVEHPGFGTRLLWFLQVNWFLLIPLLLLLAWFVLWWTRGRDSLGGRTIIPEYEPPDGLRPAALGVLLDERLDHRDVTAAIVDLAVRGIVTIRVKKGRRRLVLDEQAEARAELDSFDRALLGGLFRSGKTTVSLTSLKYEFVRRLSTLRTRVEKELVQAGYWHKAPRGVRTMWMAITAAVLVPALGLGIVFGWGYVGLTVLCGIGMLILARHMTRRSRKGLDALARVLGMQEYMVTAEKDRMKALPLDMIERLLPYAVAFGIHDRWLRTFKDIFAQAPPWYEGDHKQFRWYYLNRSLASIDRDVSRNLYSGPRPPARSGSSGGWSGGSGFSGGGFSGGGFGGGGGGGW